MIILYSTQHVIEFFHMAPIVLYYQIILTAGEGGGGE